MRNTFDFIEIEENRSSEFNENNLNWTTQVNMLQTDGVSIQCQSMLTFGKR